MEDIGSEVSQKIRAAIKAKLIELGAYVDDELPDYIMVMVANKRTRSQMDDDLQLFLSSNTKIFTSWLHTVLQKLQEVTVASFENKKDSDSKKLSKRKKSETEDGRSRKSSEEGVEKAKKHSKKHKDSKKGKKNKHKTKEKAKGKKSEKESNKEKSGKEDEKRTSQEKINKNKNLELNEAVGRAILGDLKKCKKLKSDKNESSNESSSSTNDESNLDDKCLKENENESNKPGGDIVSEDVCSKPADSVSIKKSTLEVIEDEFNIEPLKPTEKDNDTELLNIQLEESAMSKGIESNIEVQKTISAPTEKLLKEHDKIQNEKFQDKTGGENKPKSDSEESLSPEEIRKQLLLSRAKKKLEESKKAERMRSNSPDVLIVEDTIGGREKDLMSTSSRQPEAPSTHSEGRGGSSKSGSPRPSKQRSLYSERRSPQSSERSTYKRIVTDLKSKPTEMKSSFVERRKISFGKLPSPEKEKTGERRKNVIKISESLELEKNLGVKKESETKTKEESSRKRPVCSRVVTITGPKPPEISSIVKVKPREFISKDKQANKALILKAVADAEKSIATVQARPEIEPEPKKEALYTKNLREKRYEKLAITLSNLQRNVSAHDRLDRRVSVESDKSYKKRDSSDISDGVRVVSKKMSKNDDQFISSKTTIMEKNDKYIRCWLEGVEKAVKDEEMINPSDMDEIGPTHFTDEENDEEKKRKRKCTETLGDTSSKTLKITNKEGGIMRVLPNSVQKEDEPQIVVTLDGLDSKAIKDLIMKNKETVGKPLLGSSATGKKQEKSSGGAQPGEKISDRFGRLNKTNENEGGRVEKKVSKQPGGEEPTEKKPKTESKNRQLIAQLSEKFGKVDREFESRKRRRPEGDRRYAYESRRNEKDDGERNGRYYRKSERRCFRDGGFGFYRRS